ncbi:MAG: pyruvate kinase [Aulosira sp. ZfuVER01]|nr:pyruvate kinase [Aulosira sp. ZfuVER01]MDZ7999972.1 pyruvate kinase [Aulosira sp. DedVER01a]MDZ8051411.1 pyruvate kinase [Aulosira sp. ZfuCHP01]
MSNLDKNHDILCNYSGLDLLDAQNLLNTLQQLRQLVIEEGEKIFNEWRSHIQREAFVSSSLNFAYYLALRRHDLRHLQAALMPWGLTSLGRIEGRVLANLDAAIATLGAICQADPDILPNRPSIEEFFAGDRLLQQHTEELFGNTRDRRRVRIMVTLPTQAASNYEFVRDLIQRGCDCVRINCAHDTPVEWSAMIANVRLASRETGYPCKILMDLAGPKPRISMAIARKSPQRLYRGDCILLTGNLPSTICSDCFQANCSLPEVLDKLKVGAIVWIDDGSLGAQVEALTPDGVMLRITHANLKGNKIPHEKGLNFPDTDLHLSPLTDKDLQDLDFVAIHADMVGYSFVQQAADIELLQWELERRHPNTPPAIVAKIETPQAVLHLPELIVQAAAKQPFGIMIARGDLAIEIGYQRLAEIQEEILWLCEAAHVPVIWATQVLENLVKKGIPSRAEITDAAMAERAECVMLNKGPFIADAVTILDDVLTRMEAHQQKKTPQMRSLNSW